MGVSSNSRQDRQLSIAAERSTMVEANCDAALFVEPKVLGHPLLPWFVQRKIELLEKKRNEFVDFT